MPSLLRLPLLLPGDLPCGSGLQPSCSADPCCVSLGGFLSVAAVLCLLPPAKGVVGFCCASWPCLSSWSCSTWVLSTRCLVTGCSSGVFLLAVPLGRQSGLCSSSSRSGSLQASGLDRGGGGGRGGYFLWTFGVQELEPSPSGPFLTVVCPSIGRPGGTGVRSLGWQGCCGSAIVCPSSAPLHFSMLRSLYFLTAPLPSRVLLWRSSPWPSLPWVQWSLILSLLQGFLQPSLRVVVVLGVLASSHEPLPSPLFL